MNEPFETSPAHPEAGQTPAEIKKKKLWRNLFILNLCITLLLIGLFWLPMKLAQINQTLESSSVDPKSGRAAPGMMSNGGPSVPEKVYNPNLLAPVIVTVDATSEENWTYFDFSRGKPVSIHDPSSLEWDLAFRRGKIISNGGATNKFGKGGLMDLGEVDFNAVETVPEGEFIADTSTRTETENSVLAQWYKYNFLTHKLTPRKNVYILRTADGKFAKIKFMSFYCSNKEPGCIQIKFVYQNNGSRSFLKDGGSLTAAAPAGQPGI